MAAAAAAIDDDDYDSNTSWSCGANGNWSRCRSPSRSRSQNLFQNRDANEIGNEKVKRRFVVENDDETCIDSYHQLAEAIRKFAEVYAREAKQRQMIELEKQRMQFIKDLEIQRLRVLMESQMQLVKLKRKF